MCDFTPRPPKEFPTSRWATLEQLVLQLEPYAPEEVARIGPQNLRQLITEWYKGHPAFAGLAYSAWGKRLKDMHPLAHPRSLTYKVRSWPSPHRLALSTHDARSRPVLCRSSASNTLQDEEILASIAKA